MEHDWFSARIEALVEAVLTTPGHTTPDVRRAIYARGVDSGRDAAAPSASIPSGLAPFVEKVIDRAYLITDTDIGMLREAGYSEDTIYEVILSAAVGAGIARLRCGLAALRDA